MTPRSPSNRNRRLGWLAFSLLTLALVMSCSLISGRAAKSEKQGTGGEEPREALETAVTPQTKAEEISPQTKLPQSFTYARLKFDLLKAVITSEPPESEALNLEPGSKRFAVTEWKVTNPTSDMIGLNAAMNLRLNGEPHGKQVNLLVDPQDTQALTVVFGLPEGATWKNSEIILSEEGKEPARLALDGTQPEKAVYPAKIGASADPVSVETPKVTYTVKDAVMDLDSNDGRAQVSTRYAIITVSARCDEQIPCYVGPVSFRLIADGDPLGTARMDPAAEAVDPATTKQLILTFIVPADVKELVLQVGEVDKSTAQVPLELPQKP